MCDALTPACTRCVDAGVPCVALDSSTKRVAPRSIAQYLETEIAHRERLGLTTRSSPIEQSAVPQSSSRRSPRPSLADVVAKDFTPSFLGLSAAVPFARCVVVGSRIPSTRLYGATDIDEHHPRSIINPLPLGTPLNSIPLDAARYLFDNYMNRVTAQYPIFYSADIISYYNSVFGQSSDNRDCGAEASAYEIYVVSLIMAISLSTAARTQQARANSIASGLFKNAICQIPEVLTNDIRGLQALLLLLQYAFLDPGAANIWLLSGFSSQACIDLGLHRDIYSGAPTTTLDQDMRRRVFWCTYEMEVAVCCGLLRPTSLLSKNVDVPFPSEMEDLAITAIGIDPGGRPSKFTSRRIWRFRQIECEIVSVLFQNEALSDGTVSLESWMDKMEQAINAWDDEVHRSASLNTDTTLSSQWMEMDLYAYIATPYIIVTLFRPSPRVREPSSQNLMKAFSAAVKVADGYYSQANLDFGNSKYVFHPCHHSFSSAVAFLQALQRCKDTICVLYTLDEVEGFMESFSRLFSTMAERWPAASRCLEEYERLLAPVRKDYHDFVTQRVRTHSISQETSDLNPMTGFSGGLMDPIIDLDDMFNFGSFFHPSGSSAAEHSWLYSPVPTNWNTEFDFEMN